MASPVDREALDVRGSARPSSASARYPTARLRLARENPHWGYQRILGELKGHGVVVSATTVRNWPREVGMGPVGGRRGMTWREFLRIHRHSFLAVDFFTVETICCTGRTYCSSSNRVVVGRTSPARRQRHQLSG